MLNNDENIGSALLLMLSTVLNNIEMVNNMKIDIACIQETWLSSETNKLPTMKGFNFYSNPRYKRPQRGTTDVVLAFTGDIYANFQQKNIILTTVIDLEAVFNKIPCTAILLQLTKMNIRGRMLKFIRKAEQLKPI